MGHWQVSEMGQVGFCLWAQAERARLLLMRAGGAPGAAGSDGADWLEQLAHWASRETGHGPGGVGFASGNSIFQK